MCQTCRHAERNSDGGANACKITRQQLIHLVVRDDACPMGWWPDADGEIRWAGMRWLGVPEPIRWRLVLALGREPRGLDGCGCIAAVKRSWIGPIIEPWLEGVVMLRKQLAAAMTDWKAIER